MNKMMSLSRRGFLGSTAAASLSSLILGAGAISLAGCNNAEDVEVGPYAVWRELQKYLRQSPDHPIGNAEALVKANDIAGLHKFVRDEIRLVSADGYKFVMGNACKFGPRAALRAGAGTAREKAEILAQLIRQTGRQADVVEIPNVEKQVEKFFFKDFDQNFEPPLSKNVRRHIKWHRFRSGLRETLLTSLFDIKRQLCGIASVDVR